MSNIKKYTLIFLSISSLVVTGLNSENFANTNNIGLWVSSIKKDRIALETWYKSNSDQMKDQIELFQLNSQLRAQLLKCIQNRFNSLDQQLQNCQNTHVQLQAQENKYHTEIAGLEKMLEELKNQENKFRTDINNFEVAKSALLALSEENAQEIIAQLDALTQEYEIMKNQRIAFEQEFKAYTEQVQAEYFKAKSADELLKREYCE